MSGVLFGRIVFCQQFVQFNCLAWIPIVGQIVLTSNYFEGELLLFG